MFCRHIRALYETCCTNNIKLSSTDLIRIVCPSCGIEEVCPSLLCEQYDLRHPEELQFPNSAPDP